MSDDLEDIKRRLVVGHKRDGRSVYDEAAKAELVTLCMQPGASVSRLARECGVNANQVGRLRVQRCPYQTGQRPIGIFIFGSIQQFACAIKNLAPLFVLRHRR